MYCGLKKFILIFSRCKTCVLDCIFLLCEVHSSLACLLCATVVIGDKQHCLILWFFFQRFTALSLCWPVSSDRRSTTTVIVSGDVSRTFNCGGDAKQLHTTETDDKTASLWFLNLCCYSIHREQLPSFYYIRYQTIFKWARIITMNYTYSHEFCTCHV